MCRTCTELNLLSIICKSASERHHKHCVQISSRAQSMLTLRPSTDSSPLMMHSFRPVPNTMASYSVSILCADAQGNELHAQIRWVTLADLLQRSATRRVNAMQMSMQDRKPLGNYYSTSDRQGTDSLEPCRHNATAILLLLYVKHVWVQHYKPGNISSINATL